MKEYLPKNHDDFDSKLGDLLESLPQRLPVAAHVSKALPFVSEGPESEEETFLLHPHGKPALEINTKIENTHATALNSPPDSHFNIKCCCGLKGDGNVYYDKKEGEAVLCTECEYWSHIACQRNGRASKLRAKEAFFCDLCQVRVPGMGKSKKDHAAERRCVVFT